MDFRIAYANCNQASVSYFASRNLPVDSVPMEWDNKEEEIEKLTGYHCWVNTGQICDADMLKRLSGSLRMVCRCGIGYDQIDLKAAEALGICVTNTAGSMNASVGEGALVLILEALRKTYLYNRPFVAGTAWRREGVEGHSLDGKTVGLIGYGGIARQLRKYLRGFDCRVVVYDIVQDPVAERADDIRYVSLEALAGEADVVSVHCPLMESTRHLIGKRFLSWMKQSAVLVNTARGPIVDEQALIHALREERIAGAGLDVYETEPPKADNPLLHMDNVYALPHVGAFTQESARLTMSIAVDNIADFVEGRTPRNCLNTGYADHARSWR